MKLGYSVIKKGGEGKREKDLDTCRISAASHLTARTASLHINNIDAALLHYQISPLLV